MALKSISVGYVIVASLFTWLLLLTVETRWLHSQADAHAIQQRQTQQLLALERSLEQQYHTVHELRRELKAAKPLEISRIYFVNMEHRKARREFMQKWLSQQPVPYRRAVGIPGSSTGCVRGKSHPRRCMGVNGVAISRLNLISQHDMSGNVLLLEDDVTVDVARLQREFSSYGIPENWDVVRFDCNGPHIPASFHWLSPIVFSTTHDEHKYKDCLRQNPQACWFCGGAYAMLLRKSSLHKITKIWSRLPREDIDCALSQYDQEINAMPNFHSYCVQSKVVSMNMQLGFSPGGSDVPKYRR